VIASNGRAHRKIDGRLMQQANRAMVLNLIRRDPSLSRASIARETELSPATISGIVDHLLDEGLVREEAAIVTGNVGRRPVRLLFNPSARVALGIAIDLREVTAALVDLGGTVSETMRAAVPVDSDPATVVDLVAKVSRRALKRVSPDLVLGVGVAVPGVVHWPDGVNLFSPNFGWRNVPIRAMIEQRLGLPVRAENEARAVALAEYEFGAARGMRTAVFIDVGSGVGGAVIIGGALYRGEHGAAAEIGHNTVEPGGPLCGCGNRGCLEVFTSATGISARADDALAAGRQSVLASTLPHPVSVEQIMIAAASGDALACELFDRAAAYLGLAVANAVDNWDPDLVVLSGSVIRLGGRLFDEIRVFEQRFVLKTGTGSVGVARSMLGADAKLAGAASLVISEYLTTPLAAS
jgi:N-acetylglucosamine repressor